MEMCPHKSPLITEQQNIFLVFFLIHSGLNQVYAILLLQVHMHKTVLMYSGISGFWQVYKCNVLSRFCGENRLAYKLADFWAISWLLTRLLSLYFRSQLSYTEALLALWISSWATKKKLFEEQLLYYQPTNVNGIPTLRTLNIICDSKSSALNYDYDFFVVLIISWSILPPSWLYRHCNFLL